MNKYRYARTRNQGFRRPKVGADCPTVEGKTLCLINDTSSLELPEAVSQAISPASSLSTSREKLTTETKDTMNQSGNQSCGQSTDAKPNCYKCAYRGSIPGNAHSKCLHPDIKVVTEDPIAEIFGMLGSRGISATGMNLGNELSGTLGIKGNQHGINSGWFNWPINFDPVWLESCDGFEPIDSEDTQ